MSGDLPGDLRCGCLLHSLIMSEFFVSDKFADSILVFLLLRGDLLRLRYLRCSATSSSVPTWTSSIFVCFLVLSIFYLQISVRMRHVTFADYYLRANIEFQNEASTRGRYYSCTVCISCYPYLYMCTGIYTCVMFLQWL